MPESKARENRKDEKAQVAAFRKAARQLGCDESEAAFDAALKKVAKAPPKIGAKDDRRS